MSKPTFQLPKTKLSVVIWFRNGKMNEQLITTPATSGSLLDTMLMKHRVGFSEIRAVKAVQPLNLIGQAF